MRITESMSYRTLLDNVNMLNERMAHATEQVSTGKKLGHLHDAPADSAEMLQLKNQLAEIDQYQTNADTGGLFLKVTESTLNSLHDVFTAVYTRGSAAANSYNDVSARSAYASEIRSLRDQIFELSNTHVRGRYIFAGTDVISPAYSISGDTVQREGNSEVNFIDIGGNLTVQANVPGENVFDPVFARIEALLTALDNGDLDAVKSTLGQFSADLVTVGDARAHLGVDLAKLQDAEVSRLGQQLNILSRQSHISDADMAKAIADLNQTRTALQATLTAGSLLGQQNLFDFLG
jgi:flagellar hook-associated protein 3 FlgL